MSYMGAKSGSGIYQAIVAMMPPHDTYIESHFGSGVVMRAKPPAARSIAVEIDARTLAEYPPPAWAEIVLGDFHRFLLDFDFSQAGRVLIYADPPYLESTRTSRRRYRHEYDEAKHRLLLNLLRSTPAAVMISGYPSALYDELLGDWRRVELQAMTRGGPRTECVWMNFPAGAVHWSRWAGKGFTERQRIKRKAERWRANYAGLPPGEKLAVLAAILGEHGESPSVVA